MTIYDYEAAFGARDVTTKAMRQARSQWQRLYYGQPEDGQDSCQRIAYTVVSKLSGAVFGEYGASAPGMGDASLLAALERVRQSAFDRAMVEGECYLKACPGRDGIAFRVVSRDNLLVFGTDTEGRPTDVGMVERSVQQGKYYTLLERRYENDRGLPVTEYRLFCSENGDRLGQQVPLNRLHCYSGLQEKTVYPQAVPYLGLARLKMPGANCVDGSPEGVSIYAAAAGLIQNIDQNEHQMNQEFARGESRIIASKDLLTEKGLTDHLFVGLDEDPQNVGLTVFAPPLREKSFLARKLEYLRNVESVVGLRRGMLADADIEERTATEIASSVADFNLTVLRLQKMWQQTITEASQVAGALARIYGLPVPEMAISVDWGNGVLFDEGQIWSEYLQMVDKGLLKPEIALGWRFGMEAQTPEQLEAIRKRFMP